jgi:uncharacterized protein YceH (UPF0502 family)
VIRRDLSTAETRVLGCLIEKQRTTPDQYPLSRNAVRLACNQATNRDPVLNLDEATVRGALERLGRNGFVRFTSARGSRTAKYRHLAGEQLGVDDAQLSLLALLMLRGAQTPGELRGRSERLHPFASVDEVEETLSRLIEAGLAVRFHRRPGQKEDRFGHLLSSDLDDGEEAATLEEPAGEAPGHSAATPEPAEAEGDFSPLGNELANARDEPAHIRAERAPVPAEPAGHSHDLEARVTALEADLRALRQQLADLLE